MNKNQKYSVKMKTTNLPDIEVEVIATSIFEVMEKAKEKAVQEYQGFDAQVVYYADIREIFLGILLANKARDDSVVCSEPMVS